MWAHVSILWKRKKNYATLKIKGLKGHNGIKQRKQDSKKLWLEAVHKQIQQECEGVIE